MVDTLQTATLIAFFCVALLLFGMETHSAIRLKTDRPRARIASNVGLFLVGNVFSGLLIPVGVVVVAARQPPGVLAAAGLPDAVQWLVAFLLLDLWHYWEHRLLHRVPLLWRLHLVHHSDVQVDVTTSERHHPIDIVLSTAVMMAVVVVLGLPAAGVACYLLVAALVSLWTHTTLRLPEAIDRRLRRFVVTPRVHALHHSAFQPQTDSNYGAVLAIWDRLFGTYTDPARASIKRFGLSYFCSADDARFSQVLQQPFRNRRSVPDDSRPTAAPSRIRPLTVPWQKAMACAAIGVLAVSAVMWPAWVELTEAWRNHEAYQWGWLVVPLFIYVLGWHQRSAVLASTPEPDWIGLLPSIAAAGLWGVSELMNLSIGRELALVLALQGVAMATLGRRIYRRFFPAFALLFLMIPSADLLQPVLRTIALKGLELFATAAQLPHRFEGFVLLVDGRRYIVVDECSGLAFVALGMFLGHAFGLLLYSSFRKVFALALYGAGLGVVCNLVRVNAIVLIDWMHGSKMDLAAHGNIQWLGMFTVLGLLLFSVSRLHADQAPIAASRQSATDMSFGHWIAPAAAGFSMLFVVGAAGTAMARADTSFQAEDASTARPAHAPDLLESWHLVPDAASWRIDPEGHTESLVLRYQHGGRHMTVRVLQTRVLDAKLPRLRPADLASGAGREIRTQTESHCNDSGCSSALRMLVQLAGTQARQEVYSAYCADTLITASTLAARANHAWRRIRGDAAAQRSITLTFDAAGTSFNEVEPILRALQAAPASGTQQL